MARLAILGASGHGKVLADIALQTGWSDIDFFDDRWPLLSQLEHWSVAGNTEVLFEYLDSYDGVIVGIGNNNIRLIKQQQLEQRNAKLTSLIHPTAVISQSIALGLGSVVMANAVINPFVSIGRACIINTASTVDHDCQLSDGVHISPGAHLAGGIKIGYRSWVGIGANIIQLIEIGDDVIVGAGSTVIHSISSFQKVVGTPARPI
ncbi:acetyltransferase [Photobacterium damselae]|uniref:acetyltransferase n=1 Tax=Photobacterium damselae TaxID=38293 RepID=UPI000839E739|nr:acetyltransferase [Photobacterium damselae]ODA22645.1 acetyltransferase [Photobacterium damselae subsp. damselae]